MPPGWAQDDLVTDWSKLHNLLSGLEAAGALACRGDPEAHDGLTPSLDREFRAYSIGGDERYAIEQVLVVRFVKFAGMYLDPSLRDNLSDALQVSILMQHFGAATRLLDWTESIWVAAYIAARSHPEKDGCIWLFDRHALETATVSGGNRRVLISAYMNPSEPGEFWRMLFESERQLSISRADSPGEWVALLHQARNTFPRLVAQQGFFTVASRLGLDHADVIPKMVHGHTAALPCQRIVFAANLKWQLLRSLERKGITGASLFPGLDGICYHLRDLIQFARHDPGIRRLIDIVAGKPPEAPPGAKP